MPSPAALLKALSDIATRDPWAIPSSWQLYAVLGAGGLGLVMTQVAFQSSPLSASLPTIATVDPLLSVVIGVVIFDEHIHSGIGRGAGLLALLLLLALSVTRLIQAGQPQSPPAAVSGSQPEIHSINHDEIADQDLAQPEFECTGSG